MSVGEYAVWSLWVLNFYSFNQLSGSQCTMQTVIQCDKKVFTKHTKKKSKSIKITFSLSLCNQMFGIVDIVDIVVVFVVVVEIIEVIKDSQLTNSKILQADYNLKI